MSEEGEYVPLPPGPPDQPRDRTSHCALAVTCARDRKPRSARAVIFACCLAAAAVGIVAYFSSACTTSPHDKLLAATIFSSSSSSSSVFSPSFFSSSPSSSSSSSSPNRQTEQKSTGLNKGGRLRIVVIGGGPVGLVAAKGLANRVPHADITVVEKEPRERFTPEKYTDVSFIYNIARGLPQRLLSEDIWTAQDFGGTSASPGGYKDVCVINGARYALQPSKFQSVLNNTFYITRLDMVRALHRSLERSPNVHFLYGAEFTGLSGNSASCGGRLRVTAKGTWASTMTIEHGLCAEIVLGADGSRSGVRSVLRELSLPADKFRVVESKQKSTGMHFKSMKLSLAPDFLPHSCAAIISGFACKGQGIIFQESGLVPRLVSFAQADIQCDPLFRPNLTEKELRAYLTKQVPAIPWDTALSQQHAEEFCKAGQGKEFPSVTYCTDAGYVTPSNSAAVLLLGDAMHAFPPDSGQGVNAGLQDAFRLIDILSTALAHNIPQLGMPLSSQLLDAVSAYNGQTVLEAYAISQLSKVFYPYQYTTIPKDVGFVWWAMRNAAEFVGHKTLPSAVSPPVLLHVNRQGQPVPYSQIWQGYRRNSRAFQGMLFLLGVLGAGWRMTRAGS